MPIVTTTMINTVVKLTADPSTYADALAYLRQWREDPAQDTLSDDAEFWADIVAMHLEDCLAGSDYYERIALEDSLESLKEHMRWYAVMRDAYDNDAGYGSHNPVQARRMCLEFQKDNPSAHIVVYEGYTNPVCVEIYTNMDDLQ